MHEIRNVALIGLGAIGGVVAARLHDTLHGRFTVIADPVRQQRLRRDGLLLNGQRYDFTFAATDDGPKDLILIATKATALPDAIEAIAPYVGPQTLILSLLNGLDSEETVARRFGTEHLLYSYFLGHPSGREGNSIEHDGEFRIFFGQANNWPEWSDSVRRVAHLFGEANIPYQVPPDMLSSLWQKFIINIGCNQTTALLRRPYGHLQSNRRAMELAIGMMDEAEAAARRLGIAGAGEMVAEAVRVIESMNPEGKSSMLQDVEAGRPTEIGIFAGHLCRLADEYGIAVPLNRAALRILSAL